MSIIINNTCKSSKQQENYEIQIKKLKKFIQNLSFEINRLF